MTSRLVYYCDQCKLSIYRDTEELIAYQEGRYGSYEYGRYGNPTTRTLEEKIRVLEGADDCLVSSSGMNSATTMLLALVPAGGHIVTTTDCYRRTRQFIQTVNAFPFTPTRHSSIKLAIGCHTGRCCFQECLGTATDHKGHFVVLVQETESPCALFLLSQSLSTP